MIPTALPCHAMPCHANAIPFLSTSFHFFLPFHSILFHFFHSTLFHSIHSTSFYSIHSIPFCSVPFNSVLFRSVSFNFFYSIHPIPPTFHSIPPQHISSHFIPISSIPLYSILGKSTRIQMKSFWLKNGYQYFFPSFILHFTVLHQTITSFHFKT